jgi:tryptophan-rich sensory protein
MGTAALVDIALLWLAIICTCGLFWRVRILAGVLLLPYLAWVSFAAALTYAVCSLNPLLL